MNKVLVVVDMQKDFTYGALHNEDAIAVIPAVVEKVKNFEGKVIFTRDTHCANYLETQEGRKLPVEHCIKETDGWDIIDELDEYTEGASIYNKVTFGSLRLAQDLKALNEIDAIESVEVIGVCTDICVISNAMLIKAAMPEVTIKVDSSCCAGVTKESHDNALKAMTAVQIEVY